ncbi:hypothetical protein OPT61_g5676 [Boeremia exigua]|uniref:Uncharacterized protein n=1 Tax=Boeremia exigua TaxID=749465 RepID=A0ACC2I9L2_9PLEO|nr:hypothetical protein OPT61_g5676 [Boeremia exigua]
MMLPTDMEIVKDKAFRKYAELYARDNEAFFKDFSSAVVTLFELGVPFEQPEDQRPLFSEAVEEGGELRLYQ